ncbi:MAG: hypothetical protein JWM76_449 [Pseudonocardiales bacterium]|nr:hypothetical protein [Pseudonocardiales bacterium]
MHDMPRLAPMDLFTSTTTADVGSSPEALVRQVQVLTDQSAIRDLGALYVMAVDDHDLERVVACFAPKGSFTRAGNTVTGSEDLRAFYIKMMDRYITTLHTQHSHVIQVDGDSATGLVTGHAELSLEGVLMMAAYRYEDVYTRTDRRWVFEERSLRFMYVVPVQDLPIAFTGDKRIRWPETPFAAADFPETLPTWNSYR